MRANVTDHPSYRRECDDVPRQIIPQDELPLPGALFPPQHERLVITQIALWGDSEVLVDVRPAPGVVVRYVGMERLARSREGEQIRRVEERRDVGE